MAFRFGWEIRMEEEIKELRRKLSDCKTASKFLKESLEEVTNRLAEIYECFMIKGCFNCDVYSDDYNCCVTDVLAVAFVDFCNNRCMIRKAYKVLNKEFERASLIE